jgi:diguanylate cyclase (GGDEF)-like protein
METDRAEIEKELNNQETPEKRIDLLNSFIEELYHTDFAYSRELTQRALKDARGMDYTRGIARALINSGFNHIKSGLLNDSISYFSEALSLLEQMEEEHLLVVRALNGIGSAYLYKGDYSQSIQFYQRSLKLGRKYGDRLHQGKALGNLGNVHADLENYEQAIKYYLDALEIFEELNKPIEVMVSLNNIGEAYLYINDFIQGKEYLRRSLKLARDLGHQEVEADSLDSIATVYQETGDLQEALRSFRQAALILEKAGIPGKEVITRLKIASLLIDLKDFQGAEAEVERARIIREMVKSPPILKDFFLRLSGLREEQGKWSDALKAYRKFHDIDKEIATEESEKQLLSMEAKSIRKTNERIRIISRIGQEITATLDLNQVLKIVYENVKDLMDADVFGIAKYQEASKTIDFDFFVELGKRIPSISSSVDSPHSLSAWCIRNDRDVLSNDIEKDFKEFLPDCEDLSKGALPGAGDPTLSIMVTPLKTGGEIAGIMTVQSYKKYAYSTDDLDSFKALASYLAIALKNARQSELIRQQNEKLQHLASIDSLTGAYNRRYFCDELNKLWSFSQRTGAPLSLLLIDVDHFKMINDTYGHQAGDECLIHLVTILKSNAHRVTDCLARYGGEEFVILLAGTELDNAVSLAEKIRSQLESSPVNWEDKEIPLTISIGLSTGDFEERGKDSQEVFIARADKALYKAKNSGRNRVCY